MRHTKNRHFFGIFFLCLSFHLWAEIIVYPPKHIHINVAVPTQTTVNINKVITVNAPTGTTVIYNETPVYPVTTINPIALRPRVNRCLWLKDDPAANQQILITECSHSEAITPILYGQGQIKLSNGDCLYGQFITATQNQIWHGSCNASAQQWRLFNKYLIHQSSGLCLDIAENQLRLQRCNHSLFQQFH